MLNDRLQELVQLCFIKRNGQRRYKYIVFGRDKTYYVKTTDSTKPFSETDIIKMAEFVMFGGIVFQQTVDIRVQTLFADLFRYSYEIDFIQLLLKKNKKEAYPILELHVPLYRCCLFTSHSQTCI